METLTPPQSRNLDRFITATGKTEKEYQEWATQVGKQMHINTLDRIICAKLGIYTVAHLPQLLTRIPDIMWDEQQIDEHLLVNSENPLELARLWKTYRSEARMYVSVESVLAEYLKPFPKGDFERWGDVNCLSDVHKSWFKKSAVNRRAPPAGRTGGRNQRGCPDRDTISLKCLAPCNVHSSWPRRSCHVLSR